MIVVALYFLLRPLPLLPSETFLSPDADAFLILQISPEDECFVAVLQELAKRPPAEVKLAEQQREQLLTQPEQIRQVLLQMLPMRLVVLARHVERKAKQDEEGFTFSGVMSIRGLSGFGGFILRLIRGSMVEQGGRLEKYKGVKIGVSSTGLHLAKLGNNFMFAPDAETIARWVDRIREQERLMKSAAEGEGPVLPYEGPGVLGDVLGALERRAQLRCASVNSHDEVSAFLEAAGPEGGMFQKITVALLDSGIASAQVIAVGATARLVEPDAADFELLFRADDERFAGELRDRLVDLLESAAADIGIEGIRGTADGSLVRVTFRKARLRDALRGAVEQFRRASGRAPASSQR